MCTLTFVVGSSASLDSTGASFGSWRLRMDGVESGGPSLEPAAAPSRPMCRTVAQSSSASPFEDTAPLCMRTPLRECRHHAAISIPTLS